MAGFCVNCGSKLKEGAKFCENCGTKIIGVSAAVDDVSTKKATTTSIQKEPEKQQAAKTKTQLLMEQRQTEKQVAETRAKSGKKGGRALCIILVIALVICAGYTGFVKPGWIKKNPGAGKTDTVVSGGKQEGTGKNTAKDKIIAGSTILSHKSKETFTLEEGQSVIKASESGVSIDFGSFNSVDVSEVTIEEHKAEAETVYGDEGIRKVYDIDAGDAKQFDRFFTISLPYETAAADSSDEEGSVWAEYYNESTGEWELVYSEIDSETKQVVIHTDHLSKYCTYVVNNANTPNARLVSMMHKSVSDDDAYKNLQSYLNTNASELDPVKFRVYLALLGRSYDDVSQEDFEAYTADFSKLDMLVDLSDWSKDFVCAVKGLEPGCTLGYALDKFATFYSIASVSLKLVRASYGYGEMDKAKLESYKALWLYDAGQMIKFVGKTPFCAFGTLLIMAVDYSMNYFIEGVINEYKETIFKMVSYYNENHKRDILSTAYTKFYGIETWEDAIFKIYKTTIDKYDGDPEMFNSMLMAEMTQYAGRFFDESELEWIEAYEAVTEDVGRLALGSTFPDLEKFGSREYCIEQTIAQLGQEIQPAFEALKNHVAEENKKEMVKQCDCIRKYVNSPLEINVYGNGDEIAGGTAILVAKDGSYDSAWVKKVEPDGCVYFEGTVLGYIQADVPSELYIWAKGNDPKKDPAVIKCDFSVTGPVTDIELDDEGGHENADVKIPNVSGEFMIDGSDIEDVGGMDTIDAIYSGMAASVSIESNGTFRISIPSVSRTRTAENYEYAYKDEKYVITMSPVILEGRVDLSTGECIASLQDTKLNLTMERYSPSGKWWYTTNTTLSPNDSIEVEFYADDGKNINEVEIWMPVDWSKITTDEDGSRTTDHSETLTFTLTR